MYKSTLLLYCFLNISKLISAEYPQCSHVIKDVSNVSSREQYDGLWYTVSQENIQVLLHRLRLLLQANNFPSECKI